MKTLKILILMVIGMSINAADYNGVKEVMFDIENVVGKTVKFRGKIWKIDMSRDWYRVRRPAILISPVDIDTSLWYVFFKNSFKNIVMKLNKDQIVDVTCRIKINRSGMDCDLIDLKMVNDYYPAK